MRRNEHNRSAKGGGRFVAEPFPLVWLPSGANDALPCAGLAESREFQIMNVMPRLTLSLLTAALLTLGSLVAQEPGTAPATAATPASESKVPEGVQIQWFATLDRGLAEAKRTGKPILFVSAAPHCAGVSGMW
jgi:hypothetical protein